MKIIYSLLCAVSLFVMTTGDVFCSHGLSIDGELKYPADFSNFDYVSPKAVKGGTLILHSNGSFDKMNPFTLKGSAPDGMLQYVFEPLAVQSLDEPFAQYGLIAKDIDVADDNLSVTYTINENARFSDGSAITTDDIKFTIEMLKSENVHPFYPYYYEDIKDCQILDRLKIKINFKKVNRELPLITGQIKVMSKSFYEKTGFSGDGLTPPIGSGPYVVESYSRGKSITYKRNQNYWAVDHPASRGMYNFDQIVIKYYKDPVVSVEAFKAGEFDLMSVNVAKHWAKDMTGEKFDSGKIRKTKFIHGNNAGLQGFVMNTRKPLFQDRMVRKALGLAFDFDWTNKTIFYSQYKRNTSYFSNSYLAAKGLPSDSEMQILSPFKEVIPEEVFTVPMGEERAVKMTLRQRLREAAQLLKKQGWVLKDGILHNGNGQKFSFEILLVNQVFERVMAGYVENLKKIGIEATYRTIDPTLYTERINEFDFDMCVFVYGQSMSPGNEQRNFWHSDSAEKKGSRNLAGIKNQAVDSIIDKIIYAEDKKSLITACKALDRVLWHGYYIVPNWYSDGHRLVYHNKFEKPQNLPVFYDYHELIMTWWSK